MACNGSIRGYHLGRRMCVGTLVLLLAIGTARSSQAATTSSVKAPGNPKQDAKAHFRAGQNHYNLNELPEALLEFKEAYRVYPDPVFLFNLGQCERQLDHFEEAIRFYRNYLREQPKATNRQEVERRIDEMEAALKAKAAAGDQAEPAVAPPPLAAPGAPPTGAVASPAAQPEAVSARPPVDPQIAGGMPPVVDLEAVPAQPSESEASPVYKRWWFWTAAAVVVVGATVGILAATSGGGTDVPSSELGSNRIF
jgi:TolA-binding protein